MPIVYIYTGIPGNTLTIDKIQMQDDNITYRCIAQESGSKFNNYRDITVYVICKCNQNYLIYCIK